MTFSSTQYWENRYASGGNSGSGSQGLNAIWKAKTINSFVAAHHVRDVIEYGCGDGRQLQLAEYPDYTGLDVSATAISACTNLFHDDPTKTFHVLPLPWSVAADLVLSLDVIYHLPEDDVYEQHMHDVFGSALRWVILYTTDSINIDPDFVPADHVRHRPVSSYVETEFVNWHNTVTLRNPNPELGGCDFMVYWRQ